jgi:D-glutamate N-acetyltransferase
MQEAKGDGLSSLTLRSPYLILLGDAQELVDAKTGAGLVQWCPEKVMGQLRFEECLVDLGVPDLSIAEAKARGVKSIVIGVAPTGGQISQHWVRVLAQAAAAGLDVVSGLHCRLEELSGLVAAAQSTGARLLNVRTPAHNLPIGTGEKRCGRRLLTVGTDCAIGKKYSALAITRCMNARGINADFRATGQTGIMIAGQGIPIDTVVADFIAGAAEVISPANAEDHWDVIEGQGSLFNPSYAGVSLGLLHGSQPDAIVVCHDPTREVIDTARHLPLPGVAECIDLHLRCARLTNPEVCCVGVSVNTSGLDAETRASYLAQLSAQLGLPCVDPIQDGCDAIVDKIFAEFGREG